MQFTRFQIQTIQLKRYCFQISETKLQNYKPRYLARNGAVIINFILNQLSFACMACRLLICFRPRVWQWSQSYDHLPVTSVWLDTHANKD